MIWHCMNGLLRIANGKGNNRTNKIIGSNYSFVTPLETGQDGACIPDLQAMGGEDEHPLQHCGPL